MHTYFNGYREGVVFAFYDDVVETILLEIRNKKDHDIFFTNGSIEITDYSNQKDYKINALLREVSEEFSSQISVQEKDLIPIDTVFVDNINIFFYVYLITAWKGTFPEFTIEEGERFADLIWVSIPDAYETMPYDSGKYILKQIDAHLQD